MTSGRKGEVGIQVGVAGAKVWRRIVEIGLS